MRQAHLIPQFSMHSALRIDMRFDLIQNGQRPYE